MSLIAHTFVVWYEEPTLQRQFGRVLREIQENCAALVAATLKNSSAFLRIGSPHLRRTEIPELEFRDDS